ncbi:MAG: hypothetical protein DWI26_07000, partial [Planctomycetota bacterium]
MALKTLMDNRCRSERAVERLSGVGHRAVAWSIGLSLACGAISPGCSSSKKFHAGQGAGQQTASEFLSQLVRSDVTHSECAPDYQEAYGPMDIDIATLSPEQMHGLTLQECIALGVSNSKLMRDLGVTVLRTPQSLASTLDPAVVYTDPRMGEEAALSAFDANLFASSIYENNHRGYNNNFFGVNGLFLQDLSTTQYGVSKRSATGG